MVEGAQKLLDERRGRVLVVREGPEVGSAPDSGPSRRRPKGAARTQPAPQALLDGYGASTAFGLCGRVDQGNAVSRYWWELAQILSPYVPGEQPQIPGLVKLNTNESPFGPSPNAIEAVRAKAGDTLRLYPDPQSTRLREALADYQKVAPDQIFVGNGSDEVLAHAFAALLKQLEPLRFADVIYSFYTVYCGYSASTIRPSRWIRRCGCAWTTTSVAPAR